MTFLAPFLADRGGSYSLPSGGDQAGSMPASTVFYLDATDANSITAVDDTSFLNLEATPADSETQATYDFSIIAANEFQGNVGKSDAYFSKAQVAMYHNLAGTTWTKGLNFTGSAFYFGCAFRKSTVSFLNDIFFSTGYDNSAGQKGVALKALNDTTFEFTVSNGTGTYAAQETFTVTLVDGTDYLVFITYEESSGKLDLYLNGVKQSKTGISLSSPSISNAAIRLNYGGGSDGLALGTRTYAYIMGDELLTSGDEATIRSALGTAHNRTYS